LTSLFIFWAKYVSLESSFCCVFVKGDGRLCMLCVSLSYTRRRWQMLSLSREHSMLID